QGDWSSDVCSSDLAGIIIGPSVLGWVKVDLPISILSVFGLAFLLFLAGLEVELERLRGRLLLYVSLAFLASLGLALLVGYGLFAAGQAGHITAAHRDNPGCTRAWIDRAA